jgi:hypothetical protein
MLLQLGTLLRAQVSISWREVTSIMIRPKHRPEPASEKYSGWRGLTAVTEQTHSVPPSLPLSAVPSLNLLAVAAARSLVPQPFGRMQVYLSRYMIINAVKSQHSIRRSFQDRVCSSRFQKSLRDIRRHCSDAPKDLLIVIP